MATIFTTGTTGNDTLSVFYDDLASDTHVIDGLAGDDVITLTGELDLALPPGNSVDGGADFDTLVLAGYDGTDLRNWSLSGLEKIVITTSTGVDLTATQLLGLGANFQFENTGESAYALNISGDDGQDVSLANLIYLNWEQGPDAGNAWTTISGGNGEETYVAGAERVSVYGNAGDDLIYGSTKFDLLYGGDGDDIIHSGGSPNGDFIDAGAGNDELWGDGPSSVSMNGGTGSDTYHVFVGGTNQQGHMHETGTDIDTVVLHVNGSFTLGSNFENITIAAGVLGSGVGNSGNNVMTGNTLANTLIGSSGNDTLLGGGGADVLDGGTGDDTINGGNGVDTINGGTDNDLLRGNAGNDAVSGGSGDDILRGDAGIDTLTGGAGRDSMYAGLTDGFTDSFVFAAISDSGVTALTRDRVFEFVAGEDKIDLSLIDADSAAGDAQFSFIGSAGFTAEGQVRVVASGANTLIQINSSGIGGADASIMIMGVAPASLTAGDFIL